MLLKVLFDVKVSFIKMRINVLVFEILKIDPFVMLYLQVLDLFLDLE